MKVIKKTNGHKTTAVSILMILFQALTLYKPDLIDQGTEDAIELIISSGMLSTIGHKVWRNRKEIKDFIKNIFKKKNNE